MFFKLQYLENSISSKSGKDKCTCKRVRSGYMAFHIHITILEKGTALTWLTHTAVTAE